MGTIDAAFEKAARDESTPGGLPTGLVKKIAQFNAERQKFTGPDYKEYELRADFLDPLLESLGWDVNNKKGSTYDRREVIRESTTIIGGNAKAPDYGLLIDGTTRVYVEAKKPSVNIGASSAPALQIRRYCWSAGLPYGLLTDFEEFAIYDCRAIPGVDDSNHVGRLAYFTIDELEEYWPVIVGAFGRESVGSGSLERIAETVKAPKGTRPVDVEFLDEVRGWRAELAADIATRNDELDSVEVSAAVQTLIDRIIFLRNVEARGLETSESLKRAVTDDNGVYSRLLKLFHRADDRYNSGLFHFNGKDDPSELLKVDDSILSKMIGRLYYPEPYEFAAMPADILGRIYEQFLGEQITVSPDRVATVELKPEHRKGGGVYYTPSPIVEYIVQETLGPILKGKSYKEVEKLAILDPASGSGSFLIVAYQYLLDWHREYFASRPKLAKQFLEAGSDGQTRLKTFYRKHILTNNIYGVDIDPQAVEVTKLSLLLKVVEGQSLVELEVGRILPDLTTNVQCGNSLIDAGFQMPMVSSRREELEYNPFSWPDAFPHVFKRGGFDAIVGNPPYLNVDATWGKKDPRLNYLRSSYSAVYADKTDILFYFLKKTVDICRGEIGMIVSRSFLEAAKAVKLRGWLAENARVRAVLDFRHANVFPGVGINTAIVRLTKSKVPKSSLFGRYREQKLPAGYGPETLRDRKLIDEVTVPVAAIGSRSWNFGSHEVEDVLKKIDSKGQRIGDVLHIGEGMQTGANKVFQFSPSESRASELERSGLLRRRARNSDIQAYEITDAGPLMLYVEDVESFARLPQDVQEHLLSSRDTLEGRAAFKRGNCDWWRFTWPLHKSYFNRARIIAPYRASQNRFALDAAAEYLGITDTTVLYDNEQPEDLNYFLGFLNSQVLTGRFRYIAKLLGGGVMEYYENTVSELRVPRSAPGEKLHDSMVKLVTDRTAKTAELSSTIVSSEQVELEESIEILDSEIEALVVSAYELTDSEIDLLMKK
ncbi:Eco57I restriction-modification methylase domain-containing protein [Paramicrobacterium fandaimingii]|uniref:Eco57I restriction-modification methylase domain-containing protein n=1 Tax=Paramicrobacterium fandaimingii TaxID=2708079 RepID=UPI00142443C3|nr:N-6 DNA methylase [Microbacterium fandaimingii]